MSALQERVKRLQDEGDRKPETGRDPKRKKPERHTREEKRASCQDCGRHWCRDREKCRARDKECYNCGVEGHLARSERCQSKKKGKLERLKTDETGKKPEVMTGRIREVAVKAVTNEDRTAVIVRLMSPTGTGGDSMRFLTDTGVKKTILNWKDWRSLRRVCELKDAE